MFRIEQSSKRRRSLALGGPLLVAISGPADMSITVRLHSTLWVTSAFFELCALHIPCHAAGSEPFLQFSHRIAQVSVIRQPFQMVAFSGNRILGFLNPFGNKSEEFSSCVDLEGISRKSKDPRIQGLLAESAPNHQPVNQRLRNSHGKVKSTTSRDTLERWILYRAIRAQMNLLTHSEIEK